MTENGLGLQTISTKRTDFQTDRVLLLGQVTQKKKPHKMCGSLRQAKESNLTTPQLNSVIENIYTQKLIGTTCREEWPAHQLVLSNIPNLLKTLK